MRRSMALTEELADAQALGERGEVKAALKQAERVRRAALTAEDVPVLEQVLALARFVRERTEGKRHYEAGRLAYSARENIRFVGRKQALAEGREWVDPYRAPRPAAAPGTPSRDPGQSWWVEWSWAPWAFAVWLLAIAGTAAALGTIATAPGQEIPPSTWATDAAITGLGFGLLLGLFLPRPLWRGGRWLVPLAVGSGTYALAYVIAHAVGYGGGDESDTGGIGLVLLVFTVVCLGPMVIAAALGALIRVTIAATQRRAGRA
jgi:hypothetical protein